MVAIIAQNAIKIPVHPQGHDWLVVWVAKNGDAIWADSISDIVAALIPGYEELDDEVEDDLFLNARIDVIVPLASQAQSMILADMAQRGIRLTESELNAALRSKELPAGVAQWNPSEPLVLLRTSYFPYTDDPAPRGSVLWLDPSSEISFLSSLSELGEGLIFAAGNFK